MKKPWQSKTLWINLIFAIAAFVPVAKDFLNAHPELVAIAFAGINILLRLITKDKVQLLDDVA